jgi:hypothetical protein
VGDPLGAPRAGTYRFHTDNFVGEGVEVREVDGRAGATAEWALQEASPISQDASGGCTHGRGSKSLGTVQTTVTTVTTVILSKFSSV